MPCVRFDQMLSLVRLLPYNLDFIWANFVLFYSQRELQEHAEGSAQRYRQSTTRGQRPSVTHATERPSVATSATPPHFSCSLSFSLLPLEEHELEMVVESSSTLSWSLLYAAMVPHLCVLKPASFGRPACAHRRRTL